MTTPDLNPEGIYCANAYLEKAERMKKNHFWRKAGDNTFAAGVIGATVAVSIVGVEALPIAAGANFLGGAWVGGMLGVSETLAPIGLGRLVDQEDSLNKAFSALLFSKISVDELKREYHDASVEREVIAQNTERLKLGLLNLTLEEIQLISESVKYESHDANSIDLILRKLKFKYSDENYEKLRLKILEISTTDAFCPTSYGKSRPVNLKEMSKILMEK